MDYQAKVWEGRDKWGLRYLKLIIPRKLTFAGTLASVFTAGTTTEALVEQMSIPPLARLARLLPQLDSSSSEAVGNALQVAEDFATCMRDPEWVNKVKSVEGPDEVRGSVVDDMRLRAKDLQKALEKVFFSSELLRSTSIRYLSF